MIPGYGNPFSQKVRRYLKPLTLHRSRILSLEKQKRLSSTGWSNPFVYAARTTYKEMPLLECRSCQNLPPDVSLRTLSHEQWWSFREDIRSVFTRRDVAVCIFVARGRCRFIGRERTRLRVRDRHVIDVRGKARRRSLIGRVPQDNLLKLSLRESFTVLSAQRREHTFSAHAHARAHV